MLGLPPGVWSVGDGLVGWAIEEHVAGGMSTTMSFRGDVRGERMGNGAVTRVVVLSRKSVPCVLCNLVHLALPQLRPHGGCHADGPDPIRVIFRVRVVRQLKIRAPTGHIGNDRRVDPG